MLTQFPGFVISKIMPTSIHIVWVPVAYVMCLQGYITLLHLLQTSNICVVLEISRRGLTGSCGIQTSGPRADECLEMFCDALYYRAALLSLVVLEEVFLMWSLPNFFLKPNHLIASKALSKVTFSSAVPLNWSSLMQSKIKLILASRGFILEGWIWSARVNSHHEQRHIY